MEWACFWSGYFCGQSDLGLNLVDFSAKTDYNQGASIRIIIERKTAVMLTLKEFKEARSVLSGVIRTTNLVYSDAFSRATGNHVYIKPENMQVTGAYKIRGAYYKISTLTEEEKARGLVTASAGNHAQGVAYAAQIGRAHV